jgi:hypothetical protein
MNQRSTQLVVGLAYLGLIAATLWLGSLDTLAQTNAVYPASALVFLTAALSARYAVRRYHQLDELAQLIHLTALAVGFVGTLIGVFAIVVLQFSRLFDSSDIVLFLAGPNQPMVLGLYVMATMTIWYLIGWLWGRSRYR